LIEEDEGHPEMPAPPPEQEIRKNVVSRIGLVFTMRRWLVSPWQMSTLAAFIIWSVSVLVYGSVSTGTVWSELNSRDTQTVMAACGLVGALMSFYGLHLRALESALWLEVSGYISLAFIVLVYALQIGENLDAPMTALGFMLSIGFLAASVLRSAQILLYLRAKRRQDHLLVTAKAAETAVLKPPPEEAADGQ
jgi:membrane protein DedA with SNARE-associated domain